MRWTVRSMNVPPSNLQQLRDAIASAWTKIPVEHLTPCRIHALKNSGCSGSQVGERPGSRWVCLKLAGECIEGPTVDSACQSSNYTMKSKELSVDLRERIVMRHSESIQTPSPFPHFVTLQPYSKMDI